MSPPAETTPMIQFRNVSKFYPPHTYAVRDVNVAINSGEFVSIVGQSGTGKTTLVRLIIAEEHPTKGRVIVGGWDITNIRHGDIPLLRRQIGVVFQDFKLLPRKTVRENVAFALQVAGAARTQVKEVVPQVLAIVGLDSKMDRFPHQLSGGEQQRVSIARALVHRPKILVADEPTGNLDSINTREIIDLLVKINELGTTVLLVTHNRDAVNSLKKRVITLDQGIVSSDKQIGRYVL
ncbi:MAG: cell division ATP-binding protein FtsE [Patescibacteria group bacterium]